MRYYVNRWKNRTKHKYQRIICDIVAHIFRYPDYRQDLSSAISKTSQLFQQIPYAKFKENLKHKAELYRIKVHLVDEAYTSQMCSCCGVIRKANRIKRGLYRCSSCGLQLNADINAAINILRKVAPNSGTKWSSGDIISPKRLKLVDFSG